MVSMVDQMVDQNATYLTRRRGVHYYYTRRIPKELQKRLGKERIVVSLKTKSRRKAITSAIVLSEKLESFWNGMKLEEIISQHSMMLESPAQQAASITLSEALELYLFMSSKAITDEFRKGNGWLFVAFIVSHGAREQIAMKGCGIRVVRQVSWCIVLAAFHGAAMQFPNALLCPRHKQFAP